MDGVRLVPGHCLLCPVRLRALLGQSWRAQDLGSPEKRTKSLSSAVFRRWTRLFLPCFGVALLYCVLFYAGLIGIVAVGRKANFFLQLVDLVAADVRFANPFRIRGEIEAMHAYEGSMWSIPIEFAGSIFVYVLLLGTLQVSDYKRRTFITVGIALFAASVAEYPFFLFASGLCVADYVHARGGFGHIDNRQTWLSTIVWSAVFSMSIYMGSMPAPGTSFAMNGYGFLVALTPSQWMDCMGGSGFWWCVGAIALLMSASHLRHVKSLFAMRIPRYLGRISFMLYLSHRASLMLIYRHLKQLIFPLVGLAGREHIGEEGSEWLSNTFAYFLMMAFLVPVAIIVAHLLLISIDNPSVRFAKWVETLFVTRAVADIPDCIGERQSYSRQGEETVELLSVCPDGYRKELGSLELQT